MLSPETQTSIFIGAIAGLAASFYSGIVISRLIQFSALRGEALRLMREIDYMCGASPPITKHHNTEILPLVAADFYFFRHRAAGDAISRIGQEVSLAAARVNSNQLSVSDFAALMSQAQRDIRLLKKDWLSILVRGRV